MLRVFNLIEFTDVIFPVPLGWKTGLVNTDEARSEELERFSKKKFIGLWAENRLFCALASRNQCI
jgi:hypothetical protein